MRPPPDGPGCPSCVHPKSKVPGLGPASTTYFLGGHRPATSLYGPQSSHLSSGAMSPQLRGQQGGLNALISVMY